MNKRTTQNTEHEGTRERRLENNTPTLTPPPKKKEKKKKKYKT